MAEPRASRHWETYVQGFHHEHAGITERVLCAARGAGGTPYSWVLGGVPSVGRVLDIGCGSAPLGPALPGRYLGIDLAAAELAAARAHGLPGLLAAAGLQVRSDERRCFAVPLGSPGEAAQILASFYLPGTGDRRRVGALRWLQLRARPGRTFPLPLRRVVALRCSVARAPSSAQPSPGKRSGESGPRGGRRT